MTAPALIICFLLSFPEADREVDAILARVAVEEAKLTGPRKPEDKEWVKRRLELMVGVDQKIREAFENPKLAVWSHQARQHFFKRISGRMAAIDRSNTAELKDLLKIHRWFTLSAFGEEADGNAWLLVQHADHDVAFQREVLAVLAELHPSGESKPSHYAYLWDRVVTAAKKPQRYGTQGHCVSAGVWEPFDMEDPAGLDQRRASVGLRPMEDYKRIFREKGLCP